MKHHTKSPTRTVSARGLRDLLADGAEIALLDVREAGQFGESHLLFAVPLPYSRLELDVTALVPRLSTRMVLCDDSGRDVAELAARRLNALGYTDLCILEGGIAGWRAAGHGLYKGVNVPSKLFGEMIEHAYHTPRITAQELVRMKEAGENIVVVDGRPFSEYQKMTIPGSTCCPNAELPYRIPTMVTDPGAKIVVNCAGRTRSIIGAQTLINFGIPNPVFALENGTQGWYLSDLQLERGSGRKYPDHVNKEALPAQQAAARRLMQRFGVRTVSADETKSWLNDASRTTYLCDVRTPEEFHKGSLPGAVHAPGGQLVQATDQWIGVRNARIVLIDDEGVRAPVVASWLKQLGCEAYVLDGGTRAPLKGSVPARPALPTLGTISPSELKRASAAGQYTVLDLRPSMNFRKGHIPGSRWSIRPRLVAAAEGATGTIVLVADEPDMARLGAIELLEAGFSDLKLLEGGVSGWTRAGYATEESPAIPPDAECIDHLFFVHDRHAGNREAMKQYLAWETGLMAQLDEQERAAFRIGPVMSDG